MNKFFINKLLKLSKTNIAALFGVAIIFILIAVLLNINNVYAAQSKKIELKSSKVDIKYINTLTNEKVTINYNIDSAIGLPEYNSIGKIPFLHNFDYYEVGNKKYYEKEGINLSEFLEKFAKFDNASQKYILEAKCFFIPNFALIGILICVSVFVFFVVLLLYRHFKDQIIRKSKKSNKN